MTAKDFDKCFDLETAIGLSLIGDDSPVWDKDKPLVLKRYLTRISHEYCGKHLDSGLVYVSTRTVNVASGIEEEVSSSTQMLRIENVIPLIKRLNLVIE